MTDFEDRLAHVLHDAVPAPPIALDPSAARAGARRHERRKRLLAPSLAGLAVAAIAVGAFDLQHLTAQPRASAVRPAAPPPSGFTANEFRMAPPPGEVIGPLTVPRAICRPQQISATAATRRTEGGVLGVIRLVGAVVTHRDGLAERCTLPVTRGPLALLGADGGRLKVPLSRGDRTSPPSNPRPDIALNNGNAIWGFAWLGSYCGAPARAIEVPLDKANQASLRVPLRGPQPTCNAQTAASRLIDGIAGAPGQPVQPPRPDYSSLRLTGQIEPGTTHSLLAPIDLTLRTIGSAQVILDPCPAYAGRDEATARSGGFDDPIHSGYLPCTKQPAVVRPGHPLHWTVPATSLLQTPGTGAIPGTTVWVRLNIAGVPSLLLKTTAH
jgi:hypothetical protein